MASGKKTAILQVADTGPLESLVVMLRAVGYECNLPTEALRRELRSLGCDTVLGVNDLVRSGSYDRPLDLTEAGPADMSGADLYVDIKAHRNGPPVWARWPNLKGRTLWYRINGGEPEHVITTRGEDCGDEVNVPCPVLTPNLWYRLNPAEYRSTWNGAPLWKGPTPTTPDWNGLAYPHWPPFVRWADYDHRRNSIQGGGVRYEPPLCLVHNVRGWGYSDLVGPMRELGVRCHGGGSPDGLLPHSHVAARLSSALCLVHLKSSDAPGYALYEALASACPVVCTRRLVWRNRMQELFVPGETCLVVEDGESHAGLTPAEQESFVRQVGAYLERLADPDENRRIGEAGKARLEKLMWSADKPEDVASLRSFFQRNFP